MSGMRQTLGVLTLAASLTGFAGGQENSPQRIRGWGDVVDPDGDCTIRFRQGKLSITVPGTPHDLSPLYEKKNAPRVLREVTGDFSVRVKVSGDFEPGN